MEDAGTGRWRGFINTRENAFAAGSLLLGWASVITLNVDVFSACRVPGVFALLLLLVAVCSVVMNFVAAVKHSRWWYIGGIASLWLLIATLGTFACC